MSSLVSIVVPVYNTEQTLNRCVKSLLGQTYHNIEILLIDDGSQDSSKEMVDYWAKIDKRIKVIHKSNAGLGMARNTGIDYATGSYICFCDSDDYLDLNMIEECVSFAEKYQTDIIHFGLHLISINGLERGVVKTERKACYYGDEIRRKFIPGMLGNDPDTNRPFGLWMSLDGSFISKSIIERSGWRCVSERDIISEDMYSLLSIYSYVSSAGIIDSVYYNYCDNPKSLSHTFRKDRYEKIKHFYHATRALCEKKEYPETITCLIDRFYISYTIAALKQVFLSEIKFNSKILMGRTICQDELLKVVFKKALDGPYSKFQKLFMHLAYKDKVFSLYLISNIKNYID